MRYRGLCGLVIVLFVLGSGASSAPTEPKIYWTDLFGKLQRSNLDGTDVEDLVDEFAQGGVAIHFASDKLYWVDSRNARIMRCELDGSNVEEVIATGLVQPFGITIDQQDSKLYWTDAAQGKVLRADLHGSNIEEVVTMGSTTPIGIAVDSGAGKLYWTDMTDHNVQRANLDGSDQELLVTLSTSGLDEISSIAIDSAGLMMYYVGGDHVPRIQRADLNGGGIENIVRGPDVVNVFSIALDVDAGKMYWTDAHQLLDRSGTVARANLDGSKVEVVVTGLNHPLALALDLRRATQTITLDIRPGSCPNRVNLASRGVVPMAILGSNSLDVTQIDTDTLMLARADGAGNGVLPRAKRRGSVGAIADVAAVSKTGLCECHESSGDGFDDLVLKFSTRAIVGAFELLDDESTDPIALVLRGSLWDSTPFIASDCIVLVRRAPDAAPLNPYIPR